ncbi:hypothetical protein HK100_003435 [Physocladia obscura]|uniref:Cytochrome c oxidase assembly protein n=1 Tax=Physocladia obscura TaxID=109957 RepID=A0AAD5XEL0_9FUNG|nr:hypothetical protein HK100_003435 [Physocladia obscura]
MNASGNAKRAFAASVAFTTLTILGVYRLKQYEFDVRRQGIVRDDERRRQISANAADYERNEALQRSLQKDQSVTVTSA